jgi:hypothetical protein
VVGNESLREDHWLVDFAVGRDLGVGNANAQWKFGVRVADLRAKLTAAGVISGTVGGSATTTPFTIVEKSNFLGAGPRLGIEGSTPLGGQWSFDWLAGAAALFGHRELKVTTFTPTPPITNSVDFSDSGTVFNLDAQAGLSYWFSPNMKITASYRFDGYRLPFFFSACFFFWVMAGLVPAIHVFVLSNVKTWMPAIGERSDAVLRTAMCGHGGSIHLHRFAALTPT